MASPMLAVQGAIVSMLRAGVPGLSNRVYDRTPQGAAFPFAEIGSLEQIEDGGAQLDVVEVVAFVEIYSRAVGKVEANTLAEAVRLVLHDQPMTLTGARHVGTMCRTISVIDEGDGLTSRARIEFRVLVDLT